MSSLILVTCDSGAGHLKQECAADRILTFTHRLVEGPIPSGGPPETFFQRRQALYEAEGLHNEPWWFEVEDLTGDNPQYKRIWSRLPEVCLGYDPITLWIDPDANAHLVLLQLLAWLRTIPEIVPRLWLKQSESALGQRRPGDWAFPPRAVEAADISLARRAWSAFAAPTPQVWAALRDDPDLERMPGLRRTIELMLNELPDTTGLGATARRILSFTEREGWWDEVERRGETIPAVRLEQVDRRPPRIMERVIRHGPRLPLWYFEIGQALCDLAAAPVPALSGITERHFDMDMHDDRERLQRFRESPVSLTELGSRLVAGADDWSKHDPVHRWIGGTRLTNDSMWRWDEASNRLSAPDA